MKKLNPRSILQAIALFCVLAASLCLLTPGCASLDKAGVYAGDQVLYQAELTTKTSYDVIHTYVAWEESNRALLTKWPAIKESADHMRAGAKQWFATAHALHDAYAANPSDANKAALDRSINVLTTALNEAVKYMALAAQNPTQ